MKRFATLFVALGLATAGSTVIAEEAKDQVSKQDAMPQPVQMTEAQLDNVAGGLITAVLVDVVDVRNVGVNVAIPAHVNANAVIAILGTATGVQPVSGQPGNVSQRNVR